MVRIKIKKKSQSMCLNDPFIGLTVCQALC